MYRSVRESFTPWTGYSAATAACAQRGNSLAFRKRKSESVGDWCNGKGIQSAYCRYDSDISKYKRSFFARYRAPLTLLASSSLDRYVDASAASAGPSTGWSRGLATPGPATFGGPTVGQKYKVRQNVPFWKEKFKHFLTRGAPWKCLRAPRECFPMAPLWLSTGLREWRHSSVTIVHFKAYFYRMKIILATGKLINIDNLAFNKANSAF